MHKYKFTYTIVYENEAETEQDFIYQLADDMRRDWPEYINEGEIKEITE